ncbi:hypothetical protein [Clostridium botulinum]|uniref:hypothetical protein n=1 Tax=Clostridium botulinum TaxID=1491 RepID=UPI000772F066|nr:hypothetical protein [Clostridium botulinum]
MKKRAMKKWIPKHTAYCYIYKNNKSIPCKWYRFNSSKDKQECGYCKYLNHGDWQEDGTFLLWDMVKECGIADE